MLKRKNPPIRTAQTKTNKHIDDLLVLRVQLTQAKSIWVAKKDILSYTSYDMKKCLKTVL